MRHTPRCVLPVTAFSTSLSSCDIFSSNPDHYSNKCRDVECTTFQMGAAEWTEVKRRRTSSAPLANRQVGKTAGVSITIERTLCNWQTENYSQSNIWFQADPRRGGNAAGVVSIFSLEEKSNLLKYFREGSGVLFLQFTLTAGFVRYAG